MSILNERIKQCRETLGMSQAELAELLGYSDRSTIAKIEKGTNDITQSKIEAFAKVLHTTPAYLMGWENNSSGADDDSYGLVKAQQTLAKAIEQNSDLPSKDRISLLFDASDYDPMVIAFNLDFDQDYLTRWMIYGDIPPVPVIDKVLGVFQIKAKDLLDARDLKTYEGEQKEWPTSKGEHSNSQVTSPNITPELLKCISDLSEADQRLILAVLKRMNDTGEKAAVAQTESGPYFLYNFSADEQDPAEDE